MSAWAGIAWLWLHVTALCLITGLVMVAVLWALGVRPTVAKFHQGPALFSFRMLGVRWSFGPLTFGASVDVVPEGVPADSAPSPLLELSFPRRLVVHASSVLGMLLIAALCLSPARALESCLSGFGQVVNLARASERVEAFLALQPLGFRTTLGLLAAKVAALNLLPLPPLAGFLILREGLGRLRKQRPSELPFIPIWGVVLTLVLWVGWGWGAFKGLRAHGAKAAVLEAVQRE